MKVFVIDVIDPERFSDVTIPAVIKAIGYLMRDNDTQKELGA